MSDITLTASMRSNLLQLQGTSKLMDMTQGRIATGKKVNTALDGPAAYFTAKGLNDKAGDFATLKDSMGQSISSVQAADKAITAITDLIETAKGLTSSAKSATTDIVKTSLASQFNDIRTQIDRLAGDATYNGINLVQGRGTLTGGTFSDDSTTAEAAITGLTDFSRTANTAEGSYTVTMQQKVEVQTSVSSATTGRFTATTVDLDSGSNISESDAVTFVVDGTAVGTFTYNDAGNNTAAEFIEAVGANAGEGFADVSASIVGNELVVTSTDGKKLQLTGGANILSELGITHQGYQSGTDVTTSLAAVGGNVNIWTEGYSRASSSTLTVAVSGNDLVLTDGTDTTTVSFADFATGGATGTIKTASINDLVVNIAVTGTLTALTDGNTASVTKNLAAATSGTTDIVDNSTAVETALTGVSVVAPTGTAVAGSYSIEVQKNVAQLSTASLGTKTFATTATDLDSATLADNDSVDFLIDGSVVGTFVYNAATGNNTVAELQTAVDAFTDVTTAFTAAAGITFSSTAGKTLEIRANVDSGVPANSLLTQLGITEGLQNSATGTQAIDLTSGLGITGSEVYAHVTGYSSDATSNMTFAISGTDMVITDGDNSAVVALTNFNAVGVDSVTVGDMTVKLVTSTAAQSTNANPVSAAGVAAVQQVDRVTFGGSFAATDLDTRRITLDGTDYDYTNTTSGNGSVKQVDTIQVTRGTSATVDVGDEFKITVNGTTVTFAAVTATTTNDLAAIGLKAAIAGNATMAALVTATTNGSGELTLTAVTAGQALDYSTTGPSVVNTLAGTGDSNIGAGVAQTNTVTVANGNALNAETFTVVVNGTSISYQNTSGTTENETTTAAGLVSRINADVNVNELVTASSAAGVVTITSDNIGTAFTQAASTAAGVQTAAEAAGVANTANAVSVTTANTLGDDSLLDIAASFVTAHETAINAAGFTIVDNADGTLDFTANTAGKSFTIASSVTNDAQTIDATSVTATQTVNVVATQTVTIAGNVDTGDVFSTTIQGGQAVSYTAASGDTITSVASGLRAALNANATNAAIATATTNGAGLITLTEAGLGAALTTTTASGTAAATSAFDVDGTSTSAAVKDLATGLVTDGDARFKVSSSGLSETVNITAAGGAVSASNGAWGNAISLTTTTGGFVAGEKSLLTIEDNTGQFQAVVTSNSATNKVNVSASSNTVVAASNSAWGSTLGIKGDDSLMVAGQTSIVAVTSTGGSGANDMQVDFNQDATAFINVEAVDVRSNGLGVNTAVNNWATTSNIDAAVAELNTALLTLRSNAQNLSTNLSVIKTRENFTANYINALTEGADKLTLADGNEEAANMLMLQTRQQLGIQALSMASQSAQSVLSLFR